MYTTLADLPPELYDAIISCVPRDDLHRTVNALQRAIPRSPVPDHQIFEYVRLTHPQSVVLLYLRLRKDPGRAAIVRHFCLETWTVDADTVVNLLSLLPNINKLRLFIGPNFSPEHLEDMFRTPRTGADIISLRFRPYVQKATHYQFLKGAYFDSTLTEFSGWCGVGPPSLSVVQDPLDASIAPTNFAQPLVFFRLDPLSRMSRSQFTRELKHLRFRVPRREAARYISSIPNALPRLELLDMSTCNVREADLGDMVVRLPNLRALVLDGCPVVSQRLDAGAPEVEDFSHWAALGKAIAIAGVKYARDREKKIKAWIEAYYAKELAHQGTVAQGAPEQEGRRPRKGRRGIATATFSLRDAPQEEQVVQVVHDAEDVPPPDTKIRVLPPIPTLRSITVSPPASTSIDKYPTIRADFERGWAEGVLMISGYRSRLKASWFNGVARIMEVERLDPDDEDGEVGLNGLRTVVGPESFMVNLTALTGESGGKEEGICPVLCLAGPGRSDVHAEGCGHQLGWKVWNDEL